MKTKLLLILVVLVILIISGCAGAVVTDSVTEKKIRQIENPDESLTKVNVNTDGMLSDLGYGRNHPFGVGSVVLVDSKFYENKEIARGDIVLFKTKNNSVQDTDIARIVGLPGENVGIKKGQVYINQNKLDTFYGNDTSIKNNDSMKEPLTLSGNEYFILADLRWRGFHDSQAAGTAFTKEEIIGKVVGSNNKMNFDLDYLKNNAKIGQSKSEIILRFGDKFHILNADNSDVWMYEYKLSDTTKKLNDLNLEAIKEGKIKYQLLITWEGDYAIMYSYYYNGGNNDVWKLTFSPEGTQKSQVPFK